MSRATHAILKHYSSTPENPQHGDCPSGGSSWCSYQRDLANGTQLHKPIKNPFPQAVVEVMQPLFNRLGDEAFLSGCEKCYTQNRNKALHHVIWGLATKEVYSSPQEVSLAISLGVLHWNRGFHYTYSNLLPRLGMQPSPDMIKMWSKIDSERVYQSDYRNSTSPKLRRKKKRKQKTKKQDGFVRVEGDMYKSHGFYEGEKKARKKNASNKVKGKKKKGKK